MNHSLKTTLKFSTILVAVGLALPSFARADLNVTEVGAGVAIATPQGDAYQTYLRSTGGFAEVWLSDDAGKLGQYFSAHVAAGYQPYSIRGLDEYAMRQWSGFIGIEASAPKSGGWVRPFASVDIGAVFSRVYYPSSASNPVPNSSTGFAIQLRPGVMIPVWGNFGVAAAMPFTVVLNQSKFSSLAGQFSLRWAL